MFELRIEQVAFGSPGFKTCFRIRLEVFVEEQNVSPEEEQDGQDEAALHFLACYNGEAAGTARVIFTDTDTAKITRVAVRKSARGLGIGAALMRHIEARVLAAQFILDGQTQALKFYENLGYQTEGDEFIEAGIAHFRLRKQNVSKA